MRTPFLLASVLALSVASGAAQTKIDVKDIENHPFTADFNSGGKLRMYLRSGDFRIVGGSEDTITIRITGSGGRTFGRMRLI